MNINDIIVYIGVAIIATTAAYVERKIKQFETTYEPTINQVKAKFKAEIGEQQYNKDVQVIKDIVNSLNINKEQITLDVVSELIKQVGTKVHFNESEILDIITKIVKGVL
jgi:hypothetical protein